MQSGYTLSVGESYRDWSGACRDVPLLHVTQPRMSSRGKVGADGDLVHGNTVARHINSRIRD